MKLTHTRLRLYADLPRADALRLAARMRRFPAVAAAIPARMPIACIQPYFSALAMERAICD